MAQFESPVNQKQNSGNAMTFPGVKALRTAPTLSQEHPSPLLMQAILLRSVTRLFIYKAKHEPKCLTPAFHIPRSQPKSSPEATSVACKS